VYSNTIHLNVSGSVDKERAEKYIKLYDEFKIIKKILDDETQKLLKEKIDSQECKECNAKRSEVNR
jgi:hypothetical protein